MSIIQKKNQKPLNYASSRSQSATLNKNAFKDDILCMQQQ